jgi:hypothetical protein
MGKEIVPIRSKAQECRRYGLNCQDRAGAPSKPANHASPLGLVRDAQQHNRASKPRHTSKQDGERVCIRVKKIRWLVERRASQQFEPGNSAVLPKAKRRYRDDILAIPDHYDSKRIITVYGLGAAVKPVETDQRISLLVSQRIPFCLQGSKELGLVDDLDSCGHVGIFRLL